MIKIKGVSLDSNGQKKLYGEIYKNCKSIFCLNKLRIYNGYQYELVLIVCTYRGGKTVLMPIHNSLCHCKNFDIVISWGFKQLKF